MNGSQTTDADSRIDWPDHFLRTPPEERGENSNFLVTLSKALDDLEGELERMDVDSYRLSTAARQRQRDNRPYADANPDDPGAVIRWSMNGEQYAVACDAYSRLRDNVRTIGLYIHEKRKMESRPVETGESEFANARLPPADEKDVVAPSEPPHEVLGVAPDAPPEVVRGAARSLKKTHHPDADGDRDRFQKIVAAEEAMLDE